MRSKTPAIGKTFGYARVIAHEQDEALPTTR